ncbi:hypothetical protein ACB092_05G025100 [Castanea dentata]
MTTCYCGLIILAIVCIVAFFLNYTILPMLDNEFKWIRRESRLLKAFVKDVVELLHLEVQIDSERSQRQLWDSHSNAEINELQQNFETWKEETDNVVFSYRRHFSTRCALVIKYREMKRIKNLINERLELMQIFPKNIYGLLERSRSKLRGLQGKPIDEHKSASPRPPVFRGVALVSSLSEKVNNMITQNQDLITGMESQIQFVNLQLLLLHAFLKDLEEVESETAMEKAWIVDVADLINDRTDYAKRLPPDVYSWMQNLMLWKDIEWINAGFSGLYQGKDTYGFKFIRRQQQSLQSQNNTEPIDDTISAVNKIQRHLNQEQDILIDVYLEVKALLNQLKDLCKLFEDPKATEGMQGIGKTTLAKIVYNRKAIVNHFPFRAWVSVPQESNDVNTLVEDVGNQVLKIGELQEEPDGKDFWIYKMNKFLKEKKFLLVLDNILTKEAWYTLKKAFPKTTNGSKILLTTHSRTRAQFPPDNLSPSHTEALKEVVERCGGLPQAIEYLVDKISGKDVTALDLRWVPINEHFQNGWSKTLEKEDLSEGLKKCFSYFRLFPSNFEIPTRRLIALWVAQGVVKQSDVEKETQEDVAEKYLSELIGLNMIQVVQKKINGKVKTCRLPNALLELCLSKCVSSDQQLADHLNKNDASFAHIHGNNTTSADLQRYKRHVSFLSFDTREGTKPGEDIENFLRKAISSGCFKVLKVLDHERVFRPQLPNAIGNLIELKYLGLRNTFLHTLPSLIWKLKELRHLYLNQIYRRKFVHQPSSSSSKNLQTLWGVFVGEDSRLKDGLEKWTNLRKLGLALQLPLQQQRALAKCVVKLNNLECLSLRSIDEMSKPQVLYMESLSGMENLTSLYLFGKLEIPSIISEFPQSLSDLTLSASGLKNDPMPALNKLPNLKSLCLYSGSYARREMVCSRGRFTKLLVLKLWKLEMLEELQVEEGAMQNLRELDIRSCKELKFPTGLKHLKNLRELNLLEIY